MPDLTAYYLKGIFIERVVTNPLFSKYTYRLFCFTIIASTKFHKYIAPAVIKLILL